tara:strand:+ start:111 stop:329 length:219 start_codon:yes stop_codon:yes gene_type:complete
MPNFFSRELYDADNSSTLISFLSVSQNFSGTYSGLSTDVSVFSVACTGSCVSLYVVSSDINSPYVCLFFFLK